MIKRVHLTNFKCFRDVKIELEPFTVLIGRNDTGKTSLLDALTLFTSAADRNLWREAVRKGEDHATCRIQVSGDEPGSLTLTPSTPSPQYSGPAPKRDILKSFVHQVSGPYRLNVTRMRQPTKVGGKYAKSPLPSDGEGLASVIERFPYSRMGKLQQDFLSRVPTVREVRADPLTNSEGLKELRFEIAGGGIVRAEYMSDGVMLLLAFATITNDEYYPAVLMIEEPENGIHPKQLREVLRMLHSLTSRDKNPVQVILTTHSPYVLDFVPRQSVRVFRRDASSGDVEVLPFAEVEPIKELLDGGFTLGEAWFNSEEDDLERPSNVSDRAK